MYCPKCASPATEGQRFCRQCGTNLGVIVDAMDGKRTPVDFERLKVDLKDLGTSLRAGFEQAQQEFKKNQPRNRHQWGEQVGKWGHDAGNIAKQAAAEATKAANEATSSAQHWIHHKKHRNPESRRYHFQQGLLKILTGGAGTAIWYYLLMVATNSGLLESIQRILIERLDLENLTGLVPFLQMLWLLGLIPIAQGVGHLIAAAFAGSPQPEIPVAPPQPQIVPPAMNRTTTSEIRHTNEIQPDYVNPYSVTEDPTVPLQQPERERQAM